MTGFVTLSNKMYAHAGKTPYGLWGEEKHDGSSDTDISSVTQLLCENLFYSQAKFVLNLEYFNSNEIATFWIGLESIQDISSDIQP